MTPGNDAGRLQDKQLKSVQEELSDFLGSSVAPTLSQSQCQWQARTGETQEGEVQSKIPASQAVTSMPLLGASAGHPGISTLKKDMPDIFA